jgi:uncharacterized membrane protein
MSPDARLMCGISVILVPTIVYGGLTILGVLSNGASGMPAPKNLSPSQIAFYRAGHAHAGVLTLRALRGLLYAGAFLVATTTLAVGIGLIRAR